MSHSPEGRFAPDSERNPLEEAMERWGVDLNDDHAVLLKMREIQTDTEEVAALSNLWGAYQEVKDNELEEAA